MMKQARQSYKIVHKTPDRQMKIWRFLVREGVRQGGIYHCSRREYSHDGLVFLAFAQSSIG